MKCFSYLLFLILISCSVQNPDSYLYSNKEYVCNDGCAKLQTLDCKEGQPFLLKEQECSVDEECPVGKCFAGTCGISCQESCKKQNEKTNPSCWLKYNTCTDIENNCKF